MIRNATAITAAKVMGVYICFFQAEDGIRDRNVTGVQTCALPIWPSLFENDSRERPAYGRPNRRSPGVFAAEPPVAAKTAGQFRRVGADGLGYTPRRTEERSEERRVGKECRSRWWREPEKKTERVE